jgi:tetratricopeptide (TPR) repeat protein
MDNMEYIDDYFNRSNTTEQKQQFEQRVIHDISFAEDVAFYISTHDVLKQQFQIQQKERFRELYEQQKEVLPRKRPVKQIWRYAIAASAVVAVMVLSWMLISTRSSPEQLADGYIEQNWKTLDIAMSSVQDSLQQGLTLFNAGKPADALLQFENMLKNDSTNFMAKKYAGIAALRQSQYDKALFYFSALANDTALHSNPGKFYQAVALLKRSEPADIDVAKKLLQEVAANDLEGSKEAKQWLRKLD